MKNKHIYFSHLIGFTLYCATTYADLRTDADVIFDWAEAQYSTVLFPPSDTRTTDFQNQSWYFRYYAEKNIYMAVNGKSAVYVYDGNSRQLNYINEASFFLEQIKAKSVANDTSDSKCASYLKAFGNLTALVGVSCSDEKLSIKANGLPMLQNTAGEDQVMVGITAWINRVPIPFEYHWLIPIAPNWQSNIIEAKAKGPIAVAINGVPIFHYERRPDVSTMLANYSSENDTVVQGELDHCGGHSGQGDDYHYHYTLVCLLENHDLTQPIAFGLDGAPVYYGQGGTDYYGHGRFNDWNNFPTGVNVSDLDECNAYAKEDGSYVYYTQST